MLSLSKNKIMDATKEVHPIVYSDDNEPVAVALTERKTRKIVFYRLEEMSVEDVMELINRPETKIHGTHKSE